MISLTCDFDVWEENTSKSKYILINKVINAKKINMIKKRIYIWKIMRVINKKEGLWISARGI